MRAILYLTSVILVSILAVASPPGTPLQLSGTQVDKVMTLVPDINSYLVNGTYDVPSGSELVVEAGTKLLFAKDAALNIQGTLRINGSKDAQVELAGKATGAGFWQGVRINRSNSTRIDYARISGAKNGIYMHAFKPSIENTILANNVVGLFVGEYGSASEPIVKNSLITQNHEDGVVLRASSAVFEQSRETGDGEFVANTTPLLLFLSA